MRVIKNNLYMIKLFIECAPLYVFLSFVYGTLNALIPVFNSYVIKNVIDGLSANGSTIETVITYVVPFCLYSIFIVVFGLWYTKYYELKVLNKVVQTLQVRLFNMVKGVELIDFDNSEYYDRYARAVAEIDTRAKRVLDMVVNLYSSFITIGSLLGFVLVLDQWLWLYNLIGVFSYVLINFLKNKITFEYNKNVTKINRFIEYIKRIFYLNDYTKQIKEKETYDVTISKYKGKMQDLLNWTMVSAKGHRRYDFISNVITILLNSILMFYLSNRIINRELTIGDFTVLFTACQNLTSHLSKIFYVIPEMQNNSMYIDYYKDFCEYKPKRQNKGISICEDKIDICIKDICFQYGQDKILNMLNLSIPQGDKIAIVGVNGAGKSTFVKILAGLYEPCGGEVLVNQHSLCNYDIQSYNEQIVSIYQDQKIFSYSIGENILMKSSFTKEDEDRIWYALKKVGLYDKIKSCPKGIYSQVTREFDDEGVILSGGEMQRLLLAKVFVTNAKIIILDEPTNSLDNYSAETIISNIFSEFPEKTVVMISHKLRLTKLVKTIYVIDEGKIVESGDFNRLYTNNGIFTKLCDMEDL